MLELTDDVRQGLAKTAGHGALSFNTEEYAKAIDLKNTADNSFNVRDLPGGTFGQSVIDSALGTAGNIDDFLGGPTGLGDYANNYVTAQEMAMGEKPEADFSWDYLINGLPRDTGNLIGSGIGLAAPIAAATLAAPFVGVGATAAGIGGALAGAGLESMAEGGQKMRDSLANGDSLETAQDKARTVAGENMALLAPTNILGLGALKKVGQGLKTAYNGGKAVSAAGGALANYPKLSQVADFAKGAGWAGLGAMNEGAQEAWQQGIQDSVEPDTDWGILPWNWNDEQTEAFESTIGPTALMAGAGGGARLAARKLGMSDVSQEDLDVDTPLQANNNLFGAGTAEISTQGADIDEQVAHLKDGYQSVIPQVAGVLVNDFGIEGAQISSGFRTREHNKEVGGAENSYHVGDGEHGDALDIVLPDGVSAETAEAIKQRFENSGVFDEVLFHDAGSGYHLHLGGLKTDNIGNSYGSYSGDADVDSAINEMAEKYNLDPALLAAIAEQESGFNQSAQSGAGAMGIMQLMPDTAEGLGVDPSDLRGNLEGGAKYIRQMLDKYDGDVEKALAAYNAGPGSLDSVNGDISQLSGETQKYVPSVMERYNKFKNKSGGGISSSGNILDWDSTNEDFSKLDFFPKDGEQSQGTVNEFLENLAKLEESDDKATKEKGRQAQDILQQYGDDTEKLTEKAKELGYQQTVDPAEVHGRIPMRRIVSTALNNGQVTFATKKAADIFASSPIGQTMERQGKTFKVTDNFKMNEQVNAISQQVYSDNTARTKTVKNGVMADAAAANRELNGQARPPIQQNDSVLTDEDRGRLISVMPNLPPQVQQQIQEALAENDIKAVRQLLDEATNSTPLNAETDIEKAKAITRALLQNPEATTSWDGNGAVRTAAIEGFINSNNLDGLNRANKYMAQNLRDKGINPLEVLNQNIEKPNTLPAVHGERMPSTDVQREEPAIEGTVEDTVITPPYNGKPAYNENQLEAPAVESDHLNSEEFLAGLSPVERGFMEYLDKMFDNLQLGFNDVLEYLRARQKDIFNKRMESVIQQGPQGLTGAFYTNGGKMVVDNNMPQEVQNAWNQLLSMRKNFGASLANSTAEIQNEYIRVESVVKDYLTTTVTEQCKNNVSWRKLNYAITGLEAIADKARRYERSVSEEGKRGSTKSYRDISAEEGQAIEDSAVAWSGAIHQYGTTETRLRSFLNTLGSNFTKNNHGMALRAKTKYKGQPMNKAGRIEALIRDGGRVEERGKEYFAVAPNGNEVKVNKGEHNYYKWLRQNGFAQQDRAPEGAPQLAKNNGVTEDNYRARQPEYNGEESHEEYVKKEESTKGQTKPQSNDNPNASNEPMRKELIEQAAANEDTWVNSKKSELHLEDDNDTVVKLTPQELKYYQDLIKKGVVAKPELYEEAQEDVGEMDDNVEMSKEQKQLYDESNGDRDVPDSDSEPHTSGKSTKVVTADGKEYNVHYEVRPESEITVSNNLDGSVNKDYPSELQPRNRQRVGNLTQVAEIAGNLRPADLAENRMLNHGAPLIREDGVVLNGNGRIMAIRTAVKNGTDHGYKQYLIDHAEELGLNPDNIEHMENPVLVKVMDDELTADDVKAITTDTSGGQRMSASEQAKTDAKKIKPSTLNMYQPNESGELMGNNKYFLSKLLENILPADERNAYYTEDGSISKDGLMRAQRALFALAYGNDKLIDTFAETTNEQAKNLINALNANAATIAKLQRMIENGNAHDLKLRDNLVNAINALRSAVLDGKPAERIWKETSMFEEAELTPETKALAKAMDGFRKSGKKLTNFIAQLADNNLRHGDPKQETMFEGTDDFSLMKDIASAKDKIANGGQANIFEEPRAKYSREKSPVDEKNNQQENVTIEFEADTPAAQKVFDEQLTDEVKRDLRNTIAQQMTDTIEDFEALSDEVKMDRAFADLPIIRTMRVVYQTNTIQDSENNKSKLAARYEYARRCFLYDKRVPNGINRPATSNEQQKRMVGNQQKDGTKFNGSPKKQRLRENDGSGTAVPSLGEYKFIKKQFDKLVDDKLKHSSRDKSAFSIEPINPHSAESLKENGNSDTELDRLPKVPIAKLRQSEQKIVRFGKAIGVPVHFVESNETTNRGVFTHNGEIFINRKATVPAHSIFVHEFVHWLKASPENAGAYDVLHACLENSSGLFNEARINKYRGKIFDGEKMTDEEIVEEIICDAMTHTESAEKLMRAVNNVDGSLVTRIAGCLKAMWDKFCEYMNFKQHKMSNEQHLPNELSVAEFQRADTAFNKILMNLKNDNGELVFHRVGTELLLRDTNAKPVEAYQINPISYTYAFASADRSDRISPREQDSQYMSAVEAYQNESDPAKKESMLDKIRDMVQQAAKTAGFENAIPEQTRAYTVRTKPAPKKTMKVYKVFTVDDKGRPSALFVSSKDILPQNVWLDANDTFAFTDNNNGRKYIPSTKNPNSKGGATGDSRKTENISAEELAKLEEFGYIKRNKQGQYPKTITALAYRPGWHAGDLPFFPQGGKQGDGTTNYKNIHRYNQVVFECEIAYDKDYTNSTINKKGQIVYSDRQEMPTDGGYKFATNPMTSQNDLGNWYISGSLKIGRALTEEECNKILAKNGFKPQEWQAYGSGNDFVLGKLDLEKLGYTGEEFDAARKTLAPITYDDNGNIIPLSQRFNPNINDVRYSRELKHSKQSAFLMPENGKPYTMSYYHNTQPSPKMAGDMFAQSIEPSGEYIAHDTMNGSNQIPGFEYGKISFKSPLVLEHKSTGHGGWKTDLSNMFEGKKGKALSNAIKKAGHDGIITIDSKTGEILETVNLAGTKNNGNKYSRGVDLSPSTDGVAIAARANNNLVANMKGIVKKANAKFNPFHHEELENLRIDKRDKEKDLNLIEYQFVSPTRESKKYKVIQPFVMKGKQAMAKQEKLRFEFNEGMNEVDKLLGWREGFHRNDSKFKERKEALNEILLKGDLEGKEFTNDELIKAGYDAETIKGYRKMRALLDKAWKLANDTKSRIKYQSITSSTQRRAEADFADLKDKNPFAEIISKVHNPDGTVTINYKAPHVRRVAKQTVLPSELENLRKNKDVRIVETTQSLKGTTQVTYYQREASMGKLKGYIPHVFHGWYVCKVDKDGKAIVDEDGNVAMDNIVTTVNSLSEAAKLGRELAKENPNANYRVVPQTFSAPGAQEQAIVMGDFDYAKIVGKVADSMSMSITDAQAMLDNTVKMKNRGRFYGYAKQRKGFKGFEQNVYLATMKYFNQTARYAAMDSFKRDSISMYNRIFGAFDDENVTKRSTMAKWTKQYISDMNGTPTWIEKMINNTLHNFGLGEERAGGRPALWLQQKIFTYPMTILKLGVFNPSSALLNLTQLFNLYGAMGEKVLSPQAYQRLLHKGFADTFRAMSNKDSELGKLLWKDLGLDYQIGMDIASGYSNAEVSNLASLRGFAGRLAGKSMYLFRQSDAFARGVTLLTAYNKALDEGKSKAEAIEYAKEINDKVNFDYSVADEPTIFRALGPISKVFLQFKKYPVKQLELFQDFYLDGRELGLNRKQAALRTLKYMAPYMAMSGMMGIPFISLAGGLLSALVATATGDDDWDWEKKIKQYMITEFGEDSPITQWWLYGAGSFIGLNLGSRVGVGDFMGSDSYNSADGLGGLMWNQTTLGSTIQQVSKQLSYRNYAEALKAINPTIGNIALAYKGEVRTTRGRMKYQYQNMAERMWRAIGFTPLNETLAGDLASNEYAEKQEQTKAKQKAVDDFLANPSSENAARLNELGVTPKSLENESARRTMNRHQLNELAKEKEAAKKKKKPKTYSASDYLKAVQ